MSHEQPSHSENFASHGEWEAEALGMIGEFTVLPLEILGELVESAFDLE